MYKGDNLCMQKTKHINKKMFTTGDGITVISRDYTCADFKYEILKEEIEAFQSELSEEYDVMVQLTSFGSQMIMQVTNIGYQNPDVLFFYGFCNGQKAQLIQHISQLSFMLLSIKKEEPNRKPNRIGFIVKE